MSSICGRASIGKPKIQKRIPSADVATDPCDLLGPFVIVHIRAPCSTAAFQFASILFWL
jgi:hypothetical protein